MNAEAPEITPRKKLAARILLSSLFLVMVVKTFDFYVGPALREPSAWNWAKAVGSELLFLFMFVCVWFDEKLARNRNLLWTGLALFVFLFTMLP